MTELSAQAAIDLLLSNPANYATLDAIRNPAAQVATESSGRVTLLHSGSVGGGISSNTLVQGMLGQGEDILAINRTQAALLIESDDFQKAVVRALGIDVLDREIRGTSANDFFYDSTKGVWSDASAPFTVSATGNVRIISPFADASRTLTQVELVKVLEPPGSPDSTALTASRKMCSVHL